VVDTHTGQVLFIFGQRRFEHFFKANVDVLLGFSRISDVPKRDLAVALASVEGLPVLSEFLVPKSATIDLIQKRKLLLKGESICALVSVHIPFLENLVMATGIKLIIILRVKFYALDGVFM